MEMLLEEMDAAGVEQAISPVRVLNGDNDNVDAAKLCQAYPDKFFGHISVIRCHMTYLRYIRPTAMGQK